MIIMIEYKAGIQNFLFWPFKNIYFEATEGRNSFISHRFINAGIETAEMGWVWRRYVYRYFGYESFKTNKLSFNSSFSYSKN